MQRNAIAILTAALSLAIPACQTEERRSRPPSPILSTRAPERIEPIAPPPPTPRYDPPPRTPPQQTPAPRTSRLRLADIQPSGGIRSRWKVIVVHHSAASNSTPQGMDSWHRQRGWAGGLGYHFVIGNGVNYPDGQLYAGPRWKSQSTGAHCKSSAGNYMGAWRDKNFFNESGIGICLVGNFVNEQPTARQLETLEDLISLLSTHARIPPSQVFGHGEITHKTECPGRKMSMTSLRRAVAARVSGGAYSQDLPELPRVTPLILLASSAQERESEDMPYDDHGPCDERACELDAAAVVWTVSFDGAIVH